MICNKCGQQNEDNVFFCRFCGAMLKQPDEQVAWKVNAGEDPRTSFVQETVSERAEAAAVNGEPKGEKPVYAAPTATTYEVQNSGTPVQQTAQRYGAPVQQMRPPQGIPYSGGVPMRNSSDGLGLAIAALVCGISAIVIPYIGLVIGILAVVFGCVAKHKGNTGPMATAGIVCGAIGIAIGLFWIVACAVIIEVATEFYNSYPYYY